MITRKIPAFVLVVLCAMSLIVAAIGVVPGATDTSASNVTSAANTAGDGNWTQYRAGPGHAGATTDSGPTGPLVGTQWVHKGIEEDSPPVVADGTVYRSYTTNAEYTNRSGVVEAINLTTGEVVWTRNDLGSVHNTRLAVAGGHVFVHTKYTIAIEMGFETGTRLLALDAATGETVWMQNASGSPIVANGTVYLRSAAFDAATGEPRWGGANVSIDAVQNGTLYATYNADKDSDNAGWGIVALSADDRSVEWRWEPESSAAELGRATAMAVANGSVYVTAGTNETYALDAGDGSLRWQQTVDASSQDHTSDWISAPAVSNGTVYIATNDEEGGGLGDGTVHALDATDGTAEWQFETLAELKGAPVVGSDSVYIGGEREDLIGFSLDAATGEERWNFTLGRSAEEKFVDVVVDDGFVLFAHGNPQPTPRGDPDGDYVTALKSSGIPPVRDNVPTDPDGDGQFEDVNGDGRFDIVDVQALFANRDDRTIQDNPETFDFNGDGAFDIVDVQALFTELTEEN